MKKIDLSTEEGIKRFDDLLDKHLKKESRSDKVVKTILEPFIQ